MPRQSTTTKITPREAIQNVLTKTGWTPDRWGNFIKTDEKGRKLRCKFQDISMRFEVKNVQYNQWVNLRSDYYKNIVVEGNSVLIDGKPLP